MNKITVLELFSGIGSQRKALERCNIPHSIIGISEIDKFAIKSYEAIFGETKNYGDISKVEFLDYADMWTYSFPCFKAGTLILTESGFKTIESITCNDNVLTHKNRFKKVLKTMENTTKQIYQFKCMANESLFTTKEHPFYVRKRISKEKKGKKFKLEESPKWIEAKDLTLEHYMGVAINQESKIPDWNGSNFKWSDRNREDQSNLLKPKMNKNEFWWIIGRYIGDGWIRSQGGIIICCNKKNDELKDVISKLDKLEFNYSVVEERTTYKIHISFKEIEEYCIQFDKGAENKHLTSDIFNLPEHLLSSFLDGYLSADGSYTQKRYKVTTVSRKLAYGIGQCIAKVYNRPFSIYYTEQPKQTIIENRVVNQKDTYQIVFKKETNSTQDLSFYENGYLWIPITEISIIDEECKVFNLEVEEDNSYTANHIIVHNCQDVAAQGKHKGIEKGTRSGLLYEVERLLNISKEKNELPKYLLLENVKNLVNKTYKPKFDKWLEYLEELGYNNYWDILNGRNFNIPQNRERVFVVSIRKDVDDKTFGFPKPIELTFKLKDFLEENVDERYYISKELEEKFKLQILNKTISNTIRCGGRGSFDRHSWDIVAEYIKLPVVGASRGRYNEEGKTEQQLELNKTGCCNTLTSVQKDNLLIESEMYKIRKLTPKECWRLMGFCDEDFEKAEKVCSANQLYKQAGNSIIINVLEEIFKNLFK